VLNDLGQGQAYDYTLAQDTSGNLVYWPDQSDLAPQLTRNQDGTYTARRIDQLQFNFDQSGRLRSLVDRNQNQITLNYQGERLAEIAGAGGRAVAFGYDDEGRITEITDLIGRTTQYKYDRQGNLIGVIDPRGHETSYAYDDERHLIKVTDPLGQVVQQNEYDDMGRLTKQIDAKGRVFSLAYDSAARHVTATDPAGHQVTWTYPARQLALSGL
jgi:YD repeat-containing protein